LSVVELHTLRFNLNVKNVLSFTVISFYIGVQRGIICNPDMWWHLVGLTRFYYWDDFNCVTEVKLK